LQNEDIKVQNELRAEPIFPTTSQTERSRFEKNLKEIGMF
jgi:hypothetical protein